MRAAVLGLAVLLAAAPAYGDDNEAKANAADKAAEQPGARSHKGALVMSVIAVGLAGGGVGFELWGRSLLDESAHEPHPDLQDALYDKANKRHWLAQYLGVGAVGCAGIALLLWVRGGRKTASTSITLVPAADGDHIGISLVGGL